MLALLRDGVEDGIDIDDGVCDEMVMALRWIVMKMPRSRAESCGRLSERTSERAVI
jgi:hypothetical protein